MKAIRLLTAAALTGLLSANRASAQQFTAKDTAARQDTIVLVRMRIEDYRTVMLNLRGLAQLAEKKADDLQEEGKTTRNQGRGISQLSDFLEKNTLVQLPPAAAPKK
jgi:hypothetical protein